MASRHILTPSLPAIRVTDMAVIHIPFIPVVDTEWGQCPLCQSVQIEGGPVEVDGDMTEQTVSCLACHATWQEQYVAFGMSNVRREGTR